jgi:hypothetical protein
MKIRTILLLAALVILAGCYTGCALRHTVIVSTGTVIGLEVSQNPQSGLYSAKLGYDRGELALVPYTNGYVPDVVTEIHYSSIFSLTGSGIYQRMAVGPNAVIQPGAQALFLKDSNGNLGTNALSILKSVPVVNTAVQASLARVSAAYGASTNKVAWDAVAVAAGYPSFSAFISDPKVTPDAFLKVVTALRGAKLIDQ